MKKTIEVLVIVAMIGLFCSCGAEQEAACILHSLAVANAF